VGAARRRGVIFDFGNGLSGHLNRDMVERHQAGLLARHAFHRSNAKSRTTGVIDFPNVMSKLLMFGMPLAQVVACVTTNAAKVVEEFEASFPQFHDCDVRRRSDIQRAAIAEGVEPNMKGGKMHFDRRPS
jgi:predicted amidohydrolase